MPDKIMKVNYHKDLYPSLQEIEINPKGDFIDLRAAETVNLFPGDFKYISLGISAKLPEGYYAELVPRSSTFKNWGILQPNSPGIIDESYCGDNDIWKMPVFATRQTTIRINERICQFRLVKKEKPPVICPVEFLGGEDRGGFGSSGTK